MTRQHVGGAALIAVAVLAAACGRATVFGEPSAPMPAPIEAPEPGDGSGTCGQMRNCVIACDNDFVCTIGCHDDVPAAEFERHAELVSCAIALCPNGFDVPCNCAAQCRGDSPCRKQVEACFRKGREPDHFCTRFCR